MPPTLREIAKTAGVDVSTVSRVLSGKGKAFRIADGTIRRVEEAARALHFRPNLTARALRTKRTFTLGLLLSDLANPFFAGIAGAVEAVAAARGYTIMVATSVETPSRQTEYLEALLDRQIDGLIVAPVPATKGDPGLLRLARERVPLVLIDRLVEGLEDVSAVVTDNRQAAHALVSALAAQGCRRLALVGGTREAWTMRERHAGFREALREHGLKADPALVRFGSFDVKTGRDGAAALMALDEPPDAIVAANNVILLGVLEALTEAGQQVAVAGFDGFPLASLLRRPLVVAEQPVEDIGTEAARMLIDMIESGGSDREVRPGLRKVLPFRLRSYTG